MYKPNVFSTSRLADFATLQGLTTQTGFSPGDWPYVVLKETIDNLLDAAEDEGLTPWATITIEDHAIVVADEGPGIAPETVTRILDYDRQTSSRAAYIGPSRGAQGNAMQCFIAMPYVLDGRRGETVIESRGVRHEIAFTVDPIRLTPVIEHVAQPSTLTTGTRVTIRWPQSLAGKRPRLHSIAQRFLWLNPHLATAEGVPQPGRDRNKKEGLRGQCDRFSTLRPSRPWF
jgi:DNA topoisomerase VI subunit B